MFTEIEIKFLPTTELHRLESLHNILELLSVVHPYSQKVARLVTRRTIKIPTWLVGHIVKINMEV